MNTKLILTISLDELDLINIRKGSAYSLLNKNEKERIFQVAENALGRDTEVTAYDYKIIKSFINHAHENE